MVEVCGDLTLLYAGGSLLVYDHSNSESRVVRVSPESASDDSSGQPEDTEKRKKSGKEIDEEEHEDTEKKMGNETGGEEENEGKNDDKRKDGENDESSSEDGKKTGDGQKEENGKALSDNNNTYSDLDSRRITAAKFSPDGRWVVVGGGWKAVEVWSTVDWQRKVTHRLPKRPTSLAVTPDCGSVLVADRTGDVYQFPLVQPQPLPSPSGDPKPILGHLSMLLDVVVSADARYVVTCDRDEKVRVTHLAHPCLIHTFCLGHREFVTCLALLTSPHPRLLTSSGDGFIKLWDYEEGKCLSEVNVTPFASPFLLPSQPQGEGEGPGGGGEGDCTPTTAVPAVRDIAVLSGPSTHLVAALVNRARVVVLCQVVEDNLHHISTTELPAAPVAAAWRRNGGEGGGGEQLILLVENSGGGGGGGPVVVMERSGEALKVVESGLVSLGRKHCDWLKGPSSSSLGFLYKQKFDNVAEYLRKKKERLQLQETGQSLPKKGRWVK